MKKQLKYLWPICISLVFVACTEVNSPTPKQEKPSLPAITKTDTHKYYPGKFVWHDLLTDDISSAKKFYAGIFDWTFEDKEGYTLVMNKGKRIAGMIHVKPKSDTEVEAVWLPTMSVTNVDKAAKYVRSKKGKVLKGPLDMKERGKGALVSDPYGAQIVLLTAKNGDPLDGKIETGDWLWNELWTKDARKSNKFYRHLGYYDKNKKQNDYYVLASKGKWRAGIRDLSKEKIKERWVPVIRVEDPEAVSSKVKKFGGKVLMPATPSFMHGDVAVLADNTGAMFIVQRWSEGEK